MNGKSEFITRSDAEQIARRLGDALIAPVVWMAPGLNPAAAGSDVPWPGDIPIRAETYRALVRDIATALKMQGFRNIVTIGDNGGNERPLAEVAAELTAEWGPSSATRIHHIPEYYAQHGVIDRMLPEWGITINGQTIVPAIDVIEMGRKMQEIKTLATAAAIRRATSGRVTASP